MAAYGALVSITNLMEPIRQYNTRRYSVFDGQQLMQLETLETKVLFLQKFLETYSSEGRCEAEPLEDDIADVVYYAQDLIESRIVDVIRARYVQIADAEVSESAADAEDHLIESQIGDDIRALCVTAWKTDSSNLFSQDLQSVIQVLDHIQRDASKIAESDDQKDRQTGHLTSVSLHKPATVEVKDPSVIFGDAFDRMMNKLLTTRQVELQTIPITGMGGIGKTTLAQAVYDNSRIAKHFDVRGWITVSQEFNPRDILFGVLSDMKVTTNQGEYHELGVILHKHLSGRRFLIILDDIWSVEAWDKVKRFIPDNNKGSRIILTTRLSNLADSIAPSSSLSMNLLDENQSWILLKRKVFHQESCHRELEEIGKEIAKSCHGLPLSIIVIGGLLTNSLDKKYWKSIEEEVNAGVSSELSDHCLKILDTSYRHLPVHLKPCFLYFGIFSEDHKINVSEMIRLWVAEGFLKPEKGKTLEEVAHEYLQDLVNRNLIITSKFTFMRKIKFCKIHDLLRDLCLREDKKTRFRSQSSCSQNKISLRSSGEQENYSPRFNYALPSSSLIRFVLFKDPSVTEFSASELKLMRTFKPNKSSQHCISTLINVRYLEVISIRSSGGLNFMSYLIWNLRQIILYNCTIELPSEVWEMPNLRHVVSIKASIEDPCGSNGGGEDNIVLKYLQTLRIKNLRLSEELLGKIPNLKKLVVHYDDEGKVSPQHLKNICRMTQLESLSVFCDTNFSRNIESKLEFSPSIRKLYLIMEYFDWEDMGKKIGSLPHLEKLALTYRNGGEEWNSTEGEFSSLRYLFILESNLVCWTTDGASLTCLEHLVLVGMEELEEIPCEIGDISTLQSIQLYCSDSVIISAKEIVKYQQECGNHDLYLHIADYFPGFIYEINQDSIKETLNLQDKFLTQWHKLYNTVDTFQPKDEFMTRIIHDLQHFFDDTTLSWEEYISQLRNLYTTLREHMINNETSESEDELISQFGDLLPTYDAWSEASL